MAVAVVLSLWGTAVPASAQGADRETLVQGTLVAEIDDERTPVEGVELVATADGDGQGAGEVVGTAISGEDGRWAIELPAAGTYDVTIDVSTLPAEAALREGQPETRQVTVERGRQRGVVFQLGERGATGAGYVERALNLTVDGLKLGLIIALAALGLSLIYGVTGLINFAHGELVTFGAIVAWFLNTGSGPALPLVLAGLIAVVVGGVVGAGAEKGVFSPLRKRQTGNVALIVVTIGLGLALRNVYLIVFGGRSRPYRQYAIQEPLEFGPITVTPRDLIIIVVSVVVLLVVATLLQRTRLGTAMRAVADNPDLAEASGIDTRAVIMTTWIAGGALAALGGVMLGLAERVSVTMGERILLLMFAAVILGGLGRAYGALVGALLIGITVQLSTLFVSVEFKYVVAFVLLIAVLMVRPQGILGRPERVG